MKQVYFFRQGQADGSAEDRDLLGGKGANLAEMSRLDLPVPPGFTICTDICVHYMNHNSYPDSLINEVNTSLSKIESIMEQSFGNNEKPLLVSVRSGARQSMPGMMETVLNVGLTEKTLPGLICQSGDERFGYDAYRRLIMMYADVVMEKTANIVPEPHYPIRKQLESIMDKIKADKGVKSDLDLTADDLKKIVRLFKIKINSVLGEEFPDDAHTQLWGATKAVFKSWNGVRAIAYRNIEKIPHEWGTAVNIQAMVFGNMGKTSATGVAFTRNPSTGKNHFYGEWLTNAQGEDVVAGIRTPNPLNAESALVESNGYLSLDTVFPELYSQLNQIRSNLEAHYRDMQDIEFTIQRGSLWMLQTRTGKRNGQAAIQMAMDMLDEQLISEEEALLRIQPKQLDEVMHPFLDPDAELNAAILARGLPAGPGGATGQIVFHADVAEKWYNAGKDVILITKETSPEDIHGMHAAKGILTAKGGMTSHAALVARGWGKCCIVGCSALNINTENRTVTIQDSIYNEGDWFSLNGSTGKVFKNKLSLVKPDLNINVSFQKLMDLADKKRTLKVRTNADRPEDAIQARILGAQGIGLCRTEHMFFEPDRIIAMREMILAKEKSSRKTAVMKLLPFQRSDFYEILKAMAPYPVTIRLLDPPLHEFLPHTDAQVSELAVEMGIDVQDIKIRMDSLQEMNPMLGHRGCRLGITHPEITEMQAQAIFEATVQLIEEGHKPFPEVMIPLVGSATELLHQMKIVNRLADDIKKTSGIDFDYLVGTMIELPRACITADEIAEHAQFFSFGTNDLTQTVLGISRDDVGSFLPDYLDEGLISENPFESVDRVGVGPLVKMAVEKGRSVNKDLKIGICGEHGGDAPSISFFHETKLDYVSCSPFRVPIARLAAALATIKR